MGISAIAAMSVNGVIGVDGKLPWYIPKDLKHFKETTNDKVMIMGSKTYDSLPEHVRQRDCIVISNNPEKGKTFEYVINNLNPDKEYIVIGGGQIYHLFNDYIDTLYLTIVKQNYIGDTYFKFDLTKFALVEDYDVHTSAHNLTFETWCRVK